MAQVLVRHGDAGECRRSTRSRHETVIDQDIGDSPDERAGHDRAEVGEDGDREALVGIQCQTAAIAVLDPAVTHDPESVIAADLETTRIAVEPAIVEPTRSDQALDQSRVPHPGADEVIHPMDQIVHGREEVGRADVVGCGHPSIELAVRAGTVGVGAVRDDRRVVVVEERLRHGERLEDPLFRVGAQRETGHPPHRRGEQGVARVAVLKVLSRREVERALPDHQVDDVAFGDHIAVTPAREREQMRLLSQTTGVGQEMTDGDRRPEIRKLRHVAADVIVERELALVLEEQDRHRCELLGDRPDVEDRGGGDQRPVLQTGQSVTAPVEGDAILRDQDRATR